MSKWKLVPEEPTEEMLRVGIDRAYTPDAGTPEVYKAMISAAPSPPATAKDRMSDRERKAVEALQKIRHGLGEGDWRHRIGFADLYETADVALAAYEGKEEGK